ncbi:MAG: 2-amino-4-hydroxy-6-hydroxymethyldihydropteridine diphosphokinase [Bryobacterales bacterium]|nr:2-amino-4-hydroxy-6-hydroxymethyldihydropteridine diphosphokinase [Bryobacteraceae bacterium]MDW8131112.1 2-amino-4-hydroxy-6-hydroxymethyldihydropteridine diphosphokinase [Bryobacterales bacterium]
MKRIYLSLGSNLGNRERLLEGALARLAAAGIRPLRVSPVYETEPLGRRTQPWFLNLVVEAETDLLPRVLLMRIRRIELELGRRRLAPKGPRPMDIDLLLYGDAIIRSPELTVPHPRMTERRFVLAPLADLAPELRHPVDGRPIRELLEATRGQRVRRTHFRPALPA